MDTVHANYADLNQTIAKQSTITTIDLASKIETNSYQLMSITLENQNLHKENKGL